MTALIALFVLPATAVYAGNVQYIYDAAGRLTGLIDQNGNPAIYNYDANGNITSIVTPGSGSVNALGFAPTSGYVGTGVTITGTGFSANASQDSVQFNGTAAPIVSATTNQIVVTVPSGATTGAISVSSPAGKATTSQPFTVTPTPPGAPTISGFSPASGGVGDTVTITGSNFSSTAASETVAFGTADAQVTATSSNSITVLVPAGAATGPITVTTQSGTATSSSSFYAIPGGYNSTDIGGTASDSYGNSVNLNISNTNDGYLVTFSGSAGDRVSVNVLESGSNMTLSNVSIFSPNGGLLFGPVGAQTINFSNPYNPGFLLGPFVLPQTGTYTVLVVPENGSTGTAQVTVYNVPQDQTGVLSSGVGANLSLQTPGQRANFSFSGTAGERVYLNLSAPSQTYTEGMFAIYNPDGSVLYTTSNLQVYPNNSSNQYASPYVLPQTGTYHVVVAPYQSYLFSGTLTWWAIPADATTALTSGNAGSDTIGTPGQNADFTFGATAGQAISLNIANALSPITCLQWALYNPDGSTQSSGSFCSNPQFLGPITVSQTGTYRLVVNAGGEPGTGTVTTTVWNVPPNATTALTYGTASTLTIGTPGQGVDFTFSGNSGQSISINIADALSPIVCPVWTLYNPDGSVNQGGGFCSKPQFFDPFTLSQTGTYKIVISSASASTGNETVTVWNVPPDTSTTLTYGTASTLSIGTPGQGADFFFSANAGQQVSFNISDSFTTITCPYWTLYNPDGSVAQATASFCSNPVTLGAFSLSQSGLYKLVVDTKGVADTGTVTVTANNP